MSSLFSVPIPICRYIIVNVFSEYTRWCSVRSMQISTKFNFLWLPSYIIQISFVMPHVCDWWKTNTMSAQNATRQQWPTSRSRHIRRNVNNSCSVNRNCRCVNDNCNSKRSTCCGSETLPIRMALSLRRPRWRRRQVRPPAISTRNKRRASKPFAGKCLYIYRCLFCVLFRSGHMICVWMIWEHVLSRPADWGWCSGLFFGAGWFRTTVLVVQKGMADEARYAVGPFFGRERETHSSGFSCGAAGAQWGAKYVKRMQLYCKCSCFQCHMKYASGAGIWEEWWGRGSVWKRDWISRADVEYRSMMDLWKATK